MTKMNYNDIALLVMEISSQKKSKINYDEIFIKMVISFFI